MGCFIFNSHRRYSAPFSRVVRDRIYRPYVDEVLAIENILDPIADVSKAKPLARSKVVNIWHYAKGLVRNVRDHLFRVLDIITRRAFIVFRARAY
jgi:hypothetical protein